MLDQLEPNTASYNIPMAVRLTGGLNRDALQQSLDQIVRRHESLRTTFAIVDDQPGQVVSEPRPAALAFFDFSNLSPSESETAVRELIAIDIGLPFNLATGPLFRASLARLTETEHVAIFTMHHIISDGWSMGVLVRELALFYDAIINNQPSLLPELPVQYADYSIWQRDWLQGENLDAQVSYWKRQLENAPSLLNLPTDRPRPSVQTYNGGREPVELPVTLLKQLKTIGQRENATLFMTLLAAFQILLYRYSGQKDICVGSPIAGRNRVEIEGLIGFFVNALVLRTDLSDAPSFIEVLKRVREVALGAYAHQDVPFEKLVEELRPARDLSYTPLFQVMFILQSTPMDGIRVAGLSISPVELEYKTSKFDLTLSLSETPTGLQGSLEYSTDLFDRSTIQRILKHFQVLIESIVSDPSQPITQLSLITDAERHLLLKEWNQTAAPYSRKHSLPQLFEVQVDATPDAVAVESGSDRISYRELNHRANQLARHLQDLGAGPERVVGVCLQRNIEMTVALLGILKTGAAYLPLDLSYPKERLAFMVTDADPIILLTQADRLAELPEADAQVLCLDQISDSLARRSTENLESDASVHNLAYVIYTSGSTGKPKGVAVTHQGISGLLQWTRTLSPEVMRRALASTSLSFDISVWECLIVLACGGTVVLVENALQLLNDIPGGFTSILTVPSVMTELLRNRVLSASVRSVELVGEPLTESLVGQLYGQPYLEQVVNLYGPTEATVFSTQAVIERGEKGAAFNRKTAARNRSIRAG